MKNMEIDWLLVTLCILSVIGIGGFALNYIDEGYCKPLASQDALQQCRDRGFETYESFNNIALTTKALGVRCEYPTKNYNVEGQGDLIVTSN